MPVERERRVLALLRRNLPIAGIAGAILLAWVFPGPGSADSPLHPGTIVRVGVFGLFFLYGITMPRSALTASVTQWRLHLLVQVTTFAFLPLVGWILAVVLAARLGADIRLGLLFLCALPSTISSAVALTAVAKGNVAGAIFNSSVSSFLGAFLTPLWIAALAPGMLQGSPVGQLLVGTICWLVLPMMLGQLARPWCGESAPMRWWVSWFDRAVILLIVYTSFCDSFRGNVWGHHGLSTIGVLVSVCLLLYAAGFTFVRLGAMLLKLERQDRIAAVFCAPNKALAAGVIIGKLISGSDPRLGLFLLPILIYHPLQVTIGSALAARWAAGGKDKGCGP